MRRPVDPGLDACIFYVQTDFAAGFKTWGISMSEILIDLLLFSCVAAFYSGIVIAVASLLN